MLLRIAEYMVGLVGVASWGMVWAQAVSALVGSASPWLGTVSKLDGTRYRGLPC